MTRNQKIIFAIILAVAAFLIFFRLGRQDMLSDDGHYALRAYGYFDYMASLRQTTPLQWFGQRPWWSYLSFHDHPPLYFFIQHIFFKLFGAGAVVARLTSVLAGVGSVIVMFFLGRRLAGSAKFGLLAMGLLVLNNQFIWMGRIGHLESLFIFWVLLGLLFLAKAQQDAPKHYLWAGLFFGLGMLTKYTLLFMLPAILIYLLWQTRGVFRQKKFWLGIVIFVLVASPLLIYNLSMYHSRGHFDVQFSDLFGQKHNDWTLLQSRTGHFNFPAAETLGHLGSGMSWPYFILVVAALAMSFYWAWKRDQKWLYLPAMMFVVTLFFLMYVGGANRWLVVLSPFAALLLAASFWNLQERWRWLSWPGALLGVYFFIFVFNNNHAIAAASTALLTSDLRMENYGYNQLDHRIAELVAGKIIPYKTRQAVASVWFDGIKTETLPFLRDKTQPGDFHDLFIYDERTNWFPMVWLFGRHRIYEGVPSMSAAEFAQVVKDPGGRKFLNDLGFEGVYYIHASDLVEQQAHSKYPGDGIRQAFEAGGAKPEVIYDSRGREAFYIYHSSNISL